MNASITLTTITRALSDNAYLRRVCTALKVEWLWWDNHKTWTPQFENQLVKGHLRSQSIKIQSEASNCITDHCIAVGRLIYSQFANKPTRFTRSANSKESFDQSEKQRLISDSRLLPI